MNFHVTVLTFLFLAVFVNSKTLLNKKDALYWIAKGRNAVKNKIEHLKQTFGNSPFLEQKAKNVIYFLGDGMGLSTITAARIYMGNKDKKISPADGNLVFDRFPFSSLVKVNSMDKLVGDSASTSTAYLRGVKANWKTLGVSAQVKLGDCEASLIEENRVSSIFDWAQAKNKLTGFVTTTRVTHATPAGLYSFSASRKWESKTENSKCMDIATQMIHGNTARNIRVMLGGGRREFFPKNCGFDCEPGKREDGKKLVEEWLQDKKSRNLVAKYVTTDKELSAIRPRDTDYLLGLFSSSHLPYNLERNSSSTEPTLSQMVSKSIQLLNKGNNGFFLFVEGGRIDHAHHDNQAKLALDETYEFNKAIETAMSMVSLEETLILVTADHSHSLTINGYQNREANIIGKNDKQTYTTLLYGNGPGYTHKNIGSNEDIFNIKYKQKSAVYLESSAHAGEDVPVYATGPGSFMFTGVFDQTYIPHAISYVTCIGHQASLCSSGNINTVSIALFVLLTLFRLLFFR